MSLLKQRYLTLASYDPALNSPAERCILIRQGRQNIGPNAEKEALSYATLPKYPPGCWPVIRRVARMRGLISRTNAVLGMSSLAPSLVYSISQALRATAQLDHSGARISSIFKTFNLPRSHSLRTLRMHFLFLLSIDISMQHLSPHLNEISAAMPHSKTPSRPLPGLSPPQAMTRCMVSNRQARIQSSRGLSLV